MYPKIEQINNKKLQSNIPKRWLKVGLTYSILNFIYKHNFLLAVDLYNPSGAGITSAQYISAPVSLSVFNIISVIIQILSAIFTVFSGSFIFILRVNTKKEFTKWNLKNIKLIFAISAFVFILITVINLWINYIYY